MSQYSNLNFELGNFENLLKLTNDFQANSFTLISSLYVWVYRYLD